ncbi:FkbM family methyltransferase [Synechocystis sp. LEGE 06083]|uniref:FkbM family methyltransferase n=1 Tax=Synechocystis sp. LEGE 06083 TaxID=915336 RepID=UPI001881117E|nr:FkbM family methyltransferase [Synechocystis sp. LEGE 06083]MBE9195519.1 FkbM family methyltransferase [Synechocystis sp. LEGE 06083]
MPNNNPRANTLLSSPFFRRCSDNFFNFVGNLLTPSWDSRLLGITQLDIQTIIDIGANKGQFAAKMRRYFPQAQIFAFEPLPLPYQQLRQWGDRQQNRVHTFNLALGDRVDQLEINSHVLFTASSSLLPTTELCESLYPMVREQEKIIVRQSTLDGEMAQFERKLLPELLIKIDVQGYEDRVIRGGEKILGQAKACILEISLDGLYEGQCQFRDIFPLLDNLGLRYAGNLDQVVAADGHVRYLNALFLRPD